MGKIVAGSRFAMGLGDAYVARDQLADHGSGVRHRSILQESAADDGGGKIGFNDQRGAELLQDHAMRRRAAAQSAHIFGETRAQQAQIVCERPPVRFALALLGI